MIWRLQRRFVCWVQITHTRRRSCAIIVEVPSVSLSTFFPFLARLPPLLHTRNHQKTAMHMFFLQITAAVFCTGVRVQ